MAASALIAINRNRILLMQRDDYEWLRDPGKWALPGGQLEEGESFDDALVREIKEELSIELKEYKYLGLLEANGEIQGKIYFANLTDVEIKEVKLGEEGIGYGMFTASEVFNLNLTAEMQYYRTLFGNKLELFLADPKSVTPEEIGLKQ